MRPQRRSACCAPPHEAVASSHSIGGAGRPIPHHRVGDRHGGEPGGVVDTGVAATPCCAPQHDVRPTMSDHTEGPWWLGFHPETGQPLEVLAISDDNRIALLASNGREADARLIVAAPDLRRALVDLVETFHARPDILRLCGPHEHAQINAACGALNRANIRSWSSGR